MAPDALSVQIVGEYLLRVTFDTEETRLFDVRPLLERKCYASLRNEALFHTVHILYGVVTWADGTDIDPDWLYEDSVAA